jgi:hypothetical protein
MKRVKREASTSRRVSLPMLLLLLNTTLRRHLHINSRAQAQLLHDRISLRTQTAALATDHVAALNLVRDHLVKQSGHFVDAAAASGIVQFGASGGGFAVFGIGRKSGVVAAAGREESDRGKSFGVVAVAVGGGVGGD